MIPPSESHPTPPSSLFKPPPQREDWLCWASLVLAGIGLAALQRFLTWRSIVVRQVFPDYLLGESDVIFNSRVLMRLVLNTLWDWTGWDVFAINFVLQAVFASVALLATWTLARSWLARASSLVAALLAGAWCGWGFARATGAVSYPYDLPAFAFSALGLAAAARGSFGVMVACVVIGGFNKETVFWLIPVWFFAAPARDIAWRDRRLWLQSATLAATFLLVYLTPRLLLPQGEASAPLTISFIEDDPGAPWPGAPRILQNLRYLLLLRPRIGLPWIHMALALHGIPLLLWKFLPRQVRWLYAAAPFFLVPTVLLGNVWEVRIFNEMLPLTSTAILCALRPVVAKRS